MTGKQLLTEYITGERTAISTIRAFSGMFNPNQAIDILTVVCSITRVEEGDMDKETFIKVYKLDEGDNGSDPNADLQ